MSAAAAAATGVAFSSLAYTGDWDQETPGSFCPRKADWRALSKSTGQVVRVRCGANWCGYCGPRNAGLTGAAIGLAAPERFGRLSLVPDDWQEARASLHLFLQTLRRAGLRVEWCYHVEPNPKGTGNHLHFWQHGDYLPQQFVCEAAERAGMGRNSHIERAKAKGAGHGYGLKGAAGYGMKLAEAEDTQREYLRLNGNRLVHSTRGFFRDGGEALTLGGAKKRVVAAISDDPGPWVMRRVS